MITIAGWKLTLKVLHPSAAIDLGLSAGVKVIYGSILLKDTKGVHATSRDRTWSKTGLHFLTNFTMRVCFLANIIGEKSKQEQRVLLSCMSSLLLGSPRVHSTK